MVLLPLSKFVPLISNKPKVHKVYVSNQSCNLLMLKDLKRPKMWNIVNFMTGWAWLGCKGM